MSSLLKTFFFIILFSQIAHAGLNQPDDGQPKRTKTQLRKVFSANDDNDIEDEPAPFPVEIPRFKTPRELQTYVQAKSDDTPFAVEIDLVLTAQNKSKEEKSQGCIIRSKPPTHIDHWNFEDIDELYIKIEDRKSLEPILEKLSTLDKVYILMKGYSDYWLTQFCKSYAEELPGKRPHVRIEYSSSNHHSCAEAHRLKDCFENGDTGRYEINKFLDQPHLINSALYLITNDMTRKERYSVLEGLLETDPEERVRTALMLREFIMKRTSFLGTYHENKKPMEEADCGCANQSPQSHEDENYRNLIHTISTVNESAGERILEMFREYFSASPGGCDALLPYVVSLTLEESDLLENHTFNTENVQIKYKERVRRTFNFAREKLDFKNMSTKEIASIFNTLCIMDEDAERYYFDVLQPLDITVKFLRNFYEYDEEQRKWAVGFLVSKSDQLKDEEGKYKYEVEKILKFLLELAESDQTDENAEICLTLIERGYGPPVYYDNPPCMLLLNDLNQICSTYDVTDGRTIYWIQCDLETLQDIPNRVELYLTFRDDWMKEEYSGYSPERVHLSHLNHISEKNRQAALENVRVATSSLVNYKNVITVTNAILEDWRYRREKDNVEEDEIGEVELDEAEAEIKQPQPKLSFKESYNKRTRRKNNRAIRRQIKKNIPVKNWPKKLRTYLQHHTKPEAFEIPAALNPEGELS